MYRATSLPALVYVSKGQPDASDINVVGRQNECLAVLSPFRRRRKMHEGHLRDRERARHGRWCWPRRPAFAVPA